MERALTVGTIRIVSFIAGLLAAGHASLIHSDQGRRLFRSAQNTQSLVIDKLPAKACSFRLRSGVWGSREGSRFMESDDTLSGGLVATFQINLPQLTLEAKGFPDTSVRIKYTSRRFIPRRRKSNAKLRKASGAWRLFRFLSLSTAAVSRDASESPGFLCARAAVHSAAKKGHLYNLNMRLLTVCLILILLMWRIGWDNSISIYIQQDATLHSLFISGNCSTCFGWYFHPSSGAHTPASTASGICHTVTTICLYRGIVGTGLSVVWVAYVTHSTLKPVPTLPR
jgi:hypothetical protein